MLKLKIYFFLVETIYVYAMENLSKKIVKSDCGTNPMDTIMETLTLMMLNLIK